VREAENLGDFPGTAMIGTNTRTLFAFPQAKRNPLDIIALFHKQAGGNRAIDSAAHGDYDPLISIYPGHGFLDLWHIAYDVWHIVGILQP